MLQPRVEEGRGRVVIEGVTPEVDGGRFAIKRIVGEVVNVEADVFTDGHDVIACSLLFRKEQDATWQESPMQALGNDRWGGSFVVPAVGRCLYCVTGWVDRFLTWRHDLARRDDPQDVAVALQIGADLLRQAAARAPGEAEQRLESFAQRLTASDPAAGKRIGADAELVALMAKHAERHFATLYERTLAVVVDRDRARYSSWYEFFPRSCIAAGKAHGTLRECEKRLPYVAAMGFDVVYLPPIHPIGTTFRKGPNNALVASAKDPGSPWAIGAKEGGHKAILPALGALKDFRQFVKRARDDYGIDVAMDIAYQCSPDHPYVKEHPSWFRHRPDGSVQYAENPPKKYQDIYPFEFESDDWKALWEELKSVIVFWCEQGVRIFRVDNPHTKPFPMWEWLIGDVKKDFPEAIFLAEAFTRPKIMHRLAKLGFTQSYTYFSWRNTKHELMEYFRELAHSDSREYFRPNLWPNTPDILPEFLQYGGRPAFMLRVALAAMLGASYGIYGPAYELLECTARDPGTEEYLDSEKYQVRHWDLGQADSLKDFITRLNQIRRENPALQEDWTLRFHNVDNDALICFSKANDDLSNIILVVANLDPNHVQTGWVDLPLDRFGLNPEHSFQVHDLMSGARYLWQGARNFVQLDPQIAPVHVFRMRRRVRTERDFDYFL